MNIALWIIAGLLALAFSGSGLMKLTKSRSDLEPNMAWVADASDAQVKFVGAVEFLGAVGLVVPAAVDIAPILVPIAASGLAIVMIGAVATHARRKEPATAMMPAIVLGLLAVVVAVGRFGPEAF